MKAAKGVLRVTDFCPLVPGTDLLEDVQATRRELVRCITVLDGTVRLRVVIEPRGGADATPHESGMRIRCFDQPELGLHLFSTIPLMGLRTSLTIKAGQSMHLLLRWRPSYNRVARFDPVGLYSHTVSVWRHWMRQVNYRGPQATLVRRSAITIKLLDHFENGAIVAAPTSSLPERIGGSRNWDYRYAWVRDASPDPWVTKDPHMKHAMFQRTAVEQIQ